MPVPESESAPELPQYVQPALIDAPPTPTRSTVLAASLARLEQRVFLIQHGDGFRQYLAAQAKFHRYSWSNVLLILAQRPDATRVAGFKTWQGLGRKVRQGEHGIRIIVPLHRQARAHQEQSNAAGDPNGEEEEVEREASLLFGSGTVFDIQQTYGRTLPEVEVPALSGQEGQPLYARLQVVAEQEGLQVERGSERFDRPSTMGVYDPARRLIAIREAAPLQMVKTLAHELAHHFDGATVSDDVSEGLAESVAYVLCARFGLDTGERSLPYIARWYHRPDGLKRLLGRIQHTSAGLIDRVEALDAAAAEVIDQRKET